MNSVQSSTSVPTVQPIEVEKVIHNPQPDKVNTIAGPRRTVKLVDQMRESTRNTENIQSTQSTQSTSSPQAILIEVPKDNGAAVVKAPVTRRTRRSSPVHVPQETTILERWTEQNPEWRTHWHKSLVFPATGKNRATVDDGDILRLDEGEFLNDNLISFYIRYLQFKLESERPELLNKVYFFSTFFFEKLRSTKGKINYDGVKAWTAKVDLLSYDYIVVPVNEYAHWYLALICNVPNAVNGIPGEGSNQANPEHAGDSSPRIAAIERDMSDVTIRDGDTKQKSASVEIVPSLPSSPKTMQNSSPSSKATPKTTAPPGSRTSAVAAQRHDDPRAPKVVTLDSLANAHPTTCKVLREYLIAEAKDKRGVDLVKIPNGITAKKIPEQDNFCDCGVFVLGYMEEFLRDPDETVRKLLQREALGWDIRPSQIRKSLRDLLFEMQREQHERQMKEKEQKRLALAKRKALAKDADSSPMKASKDVPLTPSRISLTAAEVPGGTSDDVMPASQTSSSAVVQSTANDDAQNSGTRTLAKLPPGTPQVDASTGNREKKKNSGAGAAGGPGGPGNTRGLDPSLTRHNSIQGGMAASGTRTPAATTPAKGTKGTKGSDLTKQGLVATLTFSSSEAEGQQTRTPLKRTSIKSSADVEEVMSITRSRPIRRKSTQVESSPSLVQPLRSSQSPLPTRQQAKYDGIERSVDLT